MSDMHEWCAAEEARLRAQVSALEADLARVIQERDEARAQLARVTPAFVETWEGLDEERPCHQAIAKHAALYVACEKGETDGR